jgi:hypothetical protein
MTRKIAAAVLVCALAVVVVSARLGAQAPSGRATAASPTFSKDVAPILYKNCTNCHRPGEVAPMSLMTFKDARPWVKSISTRLTAGTMPPWHADPAHGEFLNDRRLSERDKTTLLAWANAGAPEGNPADMPAAPTYSTEWLMGQPDAVFAMQEDYPIPASGTVAYQYFEVPTNLTEDKYIQAMEVRAGDPAILHHVIVYARPPMPARPPQAAPSAPPATGAAPPQRPAPLFQFAEGTTSIPDGQTGGRPLPPEQRKPLGPNDRPAPRMGPPVGGFAPGQFTRVYQDGTALKLAAGSTLIFQMHYTPSGKATTDRTRIAFKYATRKPTTEVHIASLVNGGLHIPAGAANHRVDAEMTLGQDVTMWSLLPHTHVRGIRWEYEVTYPDGRTETVLSVPKYDFNWQTDYVFKQPLKLPKGSKLHATAWYDNSPANKSNPDATKDVWWGDQTWEEMMYTGLTFSIDAMPVTPTAGEKQ